jgi:hypothetical protein
MALGDGVADFILVVSGLRGEECAVQPRAAGSTTSTVFVNGQRVSSAESIRPVYYLLNSSYVAITYDRPTSFDSRTRAGYWTV